MIKCLDNKYQKSFLLFFIGLLAIIFTSYLLTNQLLLCHEICFINWDTIKFFPYTDFAENLTGAMNVANGYKFGVDFQQPHSPGIYLLLGIFYKLIGLGSIDPSIGSAYLRLVFSSVFLLSVVSYFFYKEFGLKPGLLILSYLLVIFYPLKLYLPMSETLSFWLAIPLLHSNLMLLNGRKQYITFEDLVLPILITFFGVGFPSVLIFPYLIYFSYLFVKSNLIKTIDLLKFFLFLMLLVSVILLMTDIDSLWFWVIGINLGDVSHNLFGNIWGNLITIDKINSLYDLMTYIPFFLFFLLLIFWWGEINYKSLIYLLIVYLLILWRVSGGYKAFASASVLISLIVFAFSRYLYKEEIYVKFFLTLLLLLSIFSTTFTNLVSGFNPNRFSKIQEFSGLNFNICKFSEGSTSDCRCVNSLVFGPQFYLQNNIKQCKYQMNTWGSRLGTSPEYMSLLYDSVSNRYASYIVPPIQFYRDDIVLAQFIKHVEKEYHCKPYNNDWKFCTY